MSMTNDLMDIPSYAPRETVEELNRFIIGQDDAKRAVAICKKKYIRKTF